MSLADHFADDVVTDVEWMHEDWERDDILYYEWTPSGTPDLVSSTQGGSYETPVAITGVFTVLNDAVTQKVFGGIQEETATLLIKPETVDDLGIILDEADKFVVDTIHYGIEELREEYVDDELHQYYMRLKRL